MADEDAARRILDALGLGNADLEPIGLGLASDAWLVRAADRGRDRSRDRRSVLRVANDPSDPTATYRMEHAIMARLTALGATVPRPIVGDWSLDDWAGPAFSLTSWVPGTPLRPEDHARAPSALAKFLRRLHGLEIPGAGGVVVGDDGLLRGEQDEVQAG
ncbi:MAG TPA: phosphotransferase, partial [Candidatus Saccharimonadales bacterium]|nr:phosphotransferase [Candidatus Saccharimonadales bacterium]